MLRLLPANAVSEKQITIAGKPFPYTATAGTLTLNDQSGDRLAAVFYTAYVAKPAAAGVFGGANASTNAARRPITFVFNGGPGAASAFLHLGLAGPRIIDFGPDGRDGAAARLRDNPETWLAFTDLVMIDPIGTGWSRTAKPDAASAFLGVKGDADSIAKVIALYVAHNSRGASPKYLLGESYGGFRAAKVARALQNDQGIIVSGIVMVSPMLETSFQWGNNREPFKAALHFPSLVATELERTKQFTPETRAAAERFALTEYMTTLAAQGPLAKRRKNFMKRSRNFRTSCRRRGQIEWLHTRGLSGQAAKRRSSQQLRRNIHHSRPCPRKRLDRGGDPMLNGSVRASQASSSAMRAMNSASRPTSPIRCSTAAVVGTGAADAASTADRVRPMT